MTLAEARVRGATSKDLDGEGTRANNPPGCVPRCPGMHWWPIGKLARAGTRGGSEKRRPIRAEERPEQDHGSAWPPRH